MSTVQRVKAALAAYAQDGLNSDGLLTLRESVALAMMMGAKVGTALVVLASCLGLLRIPLSSFAGKDCPCVQIQIGQQGGFRGQEPVTEVPYMPAPVKIAPQKKLALPRGRPCLLTKECEATLMKEIENGLPLKEAAEIAGVSYDSLNRWRIRGEDENAPSEFRHFCKALKRAKAVAMRGLVANIRDAGKSDWRAAAWMLERRHKEEFGNPQRVEHSGPGGKPIETFTTVEPEVLRRMRKQSGMVEIVKKLGAVLLRNRRQKEEADLLKNVEVAVVCPRLRE